MKEILGIIGVLVLLVEIYGRLGKYWIQRLLDQKRNAKKRRKPVVIRSKSELDCPLCVGARGKMETAKGKVLSPWIERKGRGGRNKQTSTARYFCANPECEYYRIDDEKIHALVRNGKHGKHETIRDLKCQACGKKFTSQKNPIMKKHPDSRVKSAASGRSGCTVGFKSGRINYPPRTVAAPIFGCSLTP